MILVVGATGLVGSLICYQLATDGQPVRGFVRPSSNPDKVKHLQEIGVPVVRGDLKDPQTIPPALHEVTAVISTVSSMPFSYVPGENDIDAVDLQGMKNLINAAKEARVLHVVYTSFSGNIDIEFPLRNAKRAVETHLKNSGLMYTILRPSYFMEAWLTAVVGFDVQKGKVTIYGDGNEPISYISVRDVAAFAVKSLSTPFAHNNTLELGGPEALSQLQVVKIFKEVMETSFEISHVPLEAIRQQKEGTDDPMQTSFSALMECLAKGDAIPMDEVLKEMPIRQMTAKQYARSVAL